MYNVTFHQLDINILSDAFLSTYVSSLHDSPFFLFTRVLSLPVLQQNNTKQRVFWQFELNNPGSPRDHPLVSPKPLVCFRFVHKEAQAKLLVKARKLISVRALCFNYPSMLPCLGFI